MRIPTTRQLKPGLNLRRLVAGGAAALLTVALATAGTASPASAEELDPTGGLGFDFGCAASPVAQGYLPVANDMVYDQERGYGLSQATDCRDRGGGDLLLRDFTNAAGYSFLVDLPDGDYHVTVYSGDAIASNRTSVTIQGISLGEIFVPTDEYGSVDAVVTVDSGQLDVTVGNNGRINAVEVLPAFAPTGLHVSGVDLGPPSSVALAWDESPDVAGYVVYRGGSVDDLQPVADTIEPSYLDEEVALGLTYTYAVAARTSFGAVTTLSDPVSVSVRDEAQDPPATPAGFGIVATTTSTVALDWRPVSGAVAYHVHRATDPAGPFAVVATVPGTGYTDEVVPSRNYSYYLTAVGLGGLSDPTQVVTSPVTVNEPRLLEQLSDRGVVAVPGVDGGILVRWRMLGTDPAGIAFHVYRDGNRLTGQPTSLTNYLDSDGSETSSYQVAAVVDGTEGPRSAAVQPWADGYLDIPLQRPAGGDDYDYHANDLSAADLTGDGGYDLVVQWEPSNSRDNSQSGHTAQTILDGITLDGTLLWRIEMGINIRAGAHYTQFMVYDFDGNGRAEVVAKTADGTIDGQGTVIGDPDVDYRNSSGYILTGPEFLTVFDGATGAALTTVDYHPPRGNVSSWGDNYGNRVDRFLAGVAYLDGQRPSIVMARGYYTRTVLAAYDWRGGELTQRWVFDSDDPGLGAYAGQGNHQLSVADVDGDGHDEIIYGQMTVDHDGTGLYTTGLGHGDAMHVSNFDPSRPGLEVFGVQESGGAAYGFAMRDAATGEVLWGEFTGTDVGRGTAGDIDPRYPGAEGWAIGGAWNSPTGWLYSAGGELISTTIPPANHMIWWDGDLLREVLDHEFDDAAGAGVGFIGTWDWENEQVDRLLTATGTYSNNGTKGNPGLTADLFGDWREEAIWRLEDSSALRLYATPYPTEHRFPTLMHDAQYRVAIAWQNVAYNQPPHPSFFLGLDMAPPPVPHLRTGDPAAAQLKLAPPVWATGNPNPPDVLANLTLPAGTPAAQVAVGTVAMVVDGELVAVKTTRAAVGSRLLVTFDGGQLAELMSGYHGNVAVTVSGHLVDGSSFTATATVRLR